MSLSSKEKNISEKQSLANEDYYLNEQGYIVFTETYHLKRGYCCGNSCKHCPYETTNQKSNHQK